MKRIAIILILLGLQACGSVEPAKPCVVTSDSESHISAAGIMVLGELDALDNLIGEFRQAPAGQTYTKERLISLLTRIRARVADITKDEHGQK